jgi:hypothetical protein
LFFLKDKIRTDVYEMLFITGSSIALAAMQLFTSNQSLAPEEEPLIWRLVLRIIECDAVLTPLELSFLSNTVITLSAISSTG